MAEINIKSGLLAAVALLADKGNTTTLDKFAVAIMAETIFFNDWSSINNADKISATTDSDISLKKIALFIKSKCGGKKQYETLREYNRESLYLLIETEWNIQNCNQYLIPSWSYEYDKQNGQISFDRFIKKRNEYENKSGGKKFPIEIPYCGKQTYSLNENNSEEANDGGEVINENDLKEEELNKFWEKNIVNDVYKNSMPYVWKLQISNSLYRKLKEILLSAFKVVKQRVLLDNHSEKIFVYVAEWFKWEYQPGSQNNAFTDLGIENIAGIAGRLWESLNKWQNFRYSGEANDINLYSIYALGGFPLLAILKSARIDSLFECLLHEDDPDVLIDSLLRVIPGLSDAFRQSLVDSEDGSWSRYIQAMIDHPEMLYADCDKCTNEFVKHFYKRLENGRRESVEKAIKHNWIFYTAPDSDEITGDIILNIGKDNSDGCVSAEIIKSEEEQLYIGIECQDEIVNYRKYSKTSDSKRYVGWGTTSNRIRGYIEDLSQPITLCKYNIDQLQPAKGEEIKPFELGNKYIEVYATDDGSGWTTLRDFSRKDVKAVLFPLDVYDVGGNTTQIQNKVIGDKVWTLCEITEFVQLKEKKTGKTYNLYQDGDISVSITSKTDTINYYDSSRSLVKCLINGQEQFLPLMVGVPNEKCVTIHSERNGGVPKQIRLKDISREVEYTQNYSRNIFLETKPKPGIITLDINKYKYKKRYVYLPQNAVKRDLNNGTIVFDSLSEVTKIEWISADGTTGLLNGNVYNDIDIAQLKTDDVIEDTILFRIYFSDEDYVELEIYRPINCRELKLGNQLIKRYNDNSIQNRERIKLPYILRDKFGLKVFDESGVKTISNFKDFRWFITDNTIHKCDEFDVYLYIGKQVENEPIGVFDIGAKGMEQYKFYYWSVETNTQPKIIEISYDYDRKRLVVPTECLNNRKGLIFQSLDGCCPRHYIRAIYGGETSGCVTDELIYKCYEVAAQHKVPFSQFHPLREVVKDIEKLRKLYKRVVNGDTDSKTIYADLHRFANEFSFEWTLLPISFWRLRSIDKEKAVLFMQNSNFVRTSSDKQLFGEFLEIYLKTKNIFNLIDMRGRGNMTPILRYMRGSSQDKDYRIIPNSQEDNDARKRRLDKNVNVINSLYKSNEWISELLRIFRNK